MFGKGKLTMKRKLDILKQCALGIAHLHEEQVIHRGTFHPNFLNTTFNPYLSL